MNFIGVVPKTLHVPFLLHTSWPRFMSVIRSKGFSKHYSHTWPLVICRNSYRKMKFDILSKSRSSSSHDIGLTNAIYKEHHMTKPLLHRSLEWQIITPKSDKSLFKVVKKSKIKKRTDLPTNYTEIPSLTTHQYKNEFIFWFARTWQNFEFSEKAH